MSKKSLKDKLKNFKHKEVAIAILAVFIMLVIYFSSYLKDGESKAEIIRDDYCVAMQEKLSVAIEKISGDKTAEVVINWESGVESIVAYTENKSQSSSSSSPTIVNSSGGGAPIVLKTINPKAVGVAVIIQKASVANKLDIKNMVSILLDISPEKVAVYSKK